MSSTKELIKNAIKDAEITDYIMLIRGECMTVILVEDFIKDIVFGGELICDTLLGCWKTMGQFDGGVDPDNGDADPCNCDPDFVKIHFPKGEGVRIITDEAQAVTPDSVYILKVGETGFQLIVLDEEGNKRNLTSTTPVVINIESSDNSIDVSETDGSFDLKANFPVTNGNSKGVGIPIYSKQPNSTVLDFASLSTTNLDIKLKDDGSISIDSLESGSISDFAYFVNKNYVAGPLTPSNGTRSRPYLTLKDAVYARLGINNASQDNLQLRLNPPANIKNSIVLLSNIEDDVDPFINGVIFRLEGDVEYNYSGNKTYYGDLIALYNILKIPGQPLTKDIFFEIQGEGKMTRQTGFGHIQIQNDPADGTEHMCAVRIRHEGSGIKFYENKNYAAYTPLTDENNNALFNGARVNGANIPPTTPMFNLVGKSNKYYSLECLGGETTIRTMSQVGIRADSATIYSDGKIKVEIDTIYISYIVGGKLTNYTDGGIVRPVYFKPYVARNSYELLNGATAQFNSLSFIADAPLYYNTNSIFKLTNGSSLSIPNNISSIYDLGAVSFIEYSGANNSVTINNGGVISPYTYFLKGDNVNPINLIFKNSNINTILSDEFYQAGSTDINTDGTISSIKSIPYLSIPQFWASNTEAKTTGKLKVNALYRSVTTGSTDAVVKVVV